MRTGAGVVPHLKSNRSFSQTTACWTLIWLSAKANTPSWIYNLYVRSNSRLLVYHRSSGWTESWLIKLRANGGQHKTAVCACMNWSAMAYESWDANFFFWLGIKSESGADPTSSGAKLFPQQKEDRCWSVHLRTGRSAELWSKQRLGGKKKSCTCQKGWKGKGVLRF